MSSGWILIGDLVGVGLGSIGLTEGTLLALLPASRVVGFLGSGFFFATSDFFAKGGLLAVEAFGTIFLVGALATAGFFGAAFELGVLLTAAFFEAILVATALATLFFAGIFLAGSVGFLAFFDVFARVFPLGFVEDFVEVFLAEGTVQTPNI